MVFGMRAVALLDLELGFDRVAGITAQERIWVPPARRAFPIIRPL
jgi:hypothetical protein